MSNLKSSEFLDKLIKTGADASLNLFTVSFLKNNHSSYFGREEEFRIVDIQGIVTRNSTTVSVPYQNIDIPIPNAGSEITRTLTFTMRVDSNYSILNKLRELQIIDNKGEYFRDSGKSLTIMVKALSPDPDNHGEYRESYMWKFYDCYLISISPLSYSYSSANQATVPITFIWGSYDEGIIFPSKKSELRFNSSSTSSTVGGYRRYSSEIGNPMTV